MGNTQADGDVASSLSRKRSLIPTLKRTAMTKSLPISINVEPPNIISPTHSLKDDDSELLDLVLDEVDSFYLSEKVATAQPSHSRFVEPWYLEGFASAFAVLKELGAGASCRVLQVRGLLDGEVYAVKELRSAEAANLSSWTRECRILQSLSHRNIVSFADCFYNADGLWIATEFCSGGTLLDKVVRMKSLSEIAAARYLGDILSAVEHCHQRNIVHRDLKLANIVFSKPGIAGTLKIVDFGEALLIDDDATSSECCGTIHYMPPEVVRPRTGRELKAGDLWSSGVIAFILVAGRPPFGGKDHRQIFRNIATTSTKHIFPRHVTRDFASFVRKLLRHDIEERLTAKKALQHRWLAQRQTARSMTRPPLHPILADSQSLSLSTTSVPTVLSTPSVRAVRTISLRHSKSVGNVVAAATPDSPQLPATEMSRCVSETFLTAPTMDAFPECQPMEWDCSYLDEVAVEKAWALLESDHDVRSE